MNFGNFPKGNVKGTRVAKDDTRTPLYMIFGGDLSGSMAGETRVIDEKGNESYIPKIDQLNQGFRMVQKSLLRFMKENTRFQVRYQFIELSTYCKALLPTYAAVNDPNYNLSEVTFQTGGTTNINAHFKAVRQFLNHKHLGNYNRAVNYILMSDGVPTDVDGWALSEKAWKKEVDDFKAYLVDHDLARNVELYFIAIGNEAEAFGIYFAGEDHFYKVEDSESIADALDFVTRQSLANSTTVSSDSVDDEEDEDEEDYDLGDEDEEGYDLGDEDEEGYDLGDEDEGDEDLDEDEEACRQALEERRQQILAQLSDDDSDTDAEETDDEEESEDEEEEDENDLDEEDSDEIEDDDAANNDDSDDDDGGDGEGGDGDGDDSLDDILNF